MSKRRRAKPPPTRIPTRIILPADLAAAEALRVAGGVCDRCGGRPGALLAVEQSGAWGAECFRRDRCDARIRAELRGEGS